VSRFLKKKRIYQIITLQRDNQIKPGLRIHTTCFDSKPRVRNGLGLEVKPSHSYHRSSPFRDDGRYLLPGERENCVDLLPFLVLMETPVEDPLKRLD
jgi:hypothetical protein